MKILIAPMASIAETSGPFMRAKVLAEELLSREQEVALCAAEEINYQPIPSVRNFPAPIPSPMGLPVFIGNKVFGLAKLTGLQSRRPVRSFEEVLFIVGAIDGAFFRKDVSTILSAIHEYKPDILYAEFRVSAIVAAKLAGIPVVTGYSYPVQKSYACNLEFSRGVLTFLKKCGLPPVDSVLELFQWANMRIVPSSHTLEPIEGKGVIFAGPYESSHCQNTAGNGKRKNIVVYMGNGSITPQKTLRILSSAFYGTQYNVFIASKQLKVIDTGNIHVRDRYDFAQLLPDGAVFINHGGQNSIMTGLLYGVPQIVCPGNVFERKYNGASIEQIGAGVVVENRNFSSKALLNLVQHLSLDNSYFEKAENAGKELASLGGAKTAADKILQLASMRQTP